MIKTFIISIVLVLMACLCPGQNNGLDELKSYQSLIKQFNQQLDSINKIELNTNTNAFFEEIGNVDKSLTFLWLESFYNFGLKAYRGGVPELLVTILNPISNFSWSFEVDSVNDKIGRTLNLLGVGLKGIYQSEASIEAQILAISYFDKCKSGDAGIIPSLYNNIGNSYRQNGDLSKAIEYLSEGLRICVKNLGNQEDGENFNNLNSLLAKIKANLGFAYITTQNYSQGLQFCEESDSLAIAFAPEILVTIYGNTGICYEALAKYDLAIEYYQKAIHLALESGDTNDLLNHQCNLLSTYSKLNRKIEFNRDLRNIRNELLLRINSQTYKRLLSQTHIQESQIHYFENNFEEAIVSLTSALKTAEPRIGDWHAGSPLAANLLTDQPYLSIEILNLLSQSLADLGQKTIDVKQLEASLVYLTTSEQIIDSLRSNLTTEESKLLLNQQQKNTYAVKADLCKDLFELTENPNYLDELFTTCEKGKTAGLWSEIQQLDLKSKYISTDLLIKEKETRQELAQIQKRINSLSENPSAKSEDQLEELKTKRFELSSRIDSLLRIYNDTDSEYYALKFSNKTIRIAELQESLNPNEVFVQFFYGNQYLHQLVIGKDFSKYTAIEEPDSIKSTTGQLLEHLNSRRNINRQSTVDFFNLSSSLYSSLIEPIKSEIESKSLIVSGDHNLNLLPFEILVENDSIADNEDFRDFNYFIFKHDINYSYTATLWNYVKENNSAKGKKKRTLAFAPVYKHDDGISFSDQYGEYLPTLPGTLEEVRFLNKNFNSKSYTHNKATIDNFKKEVQNAEVLHLAMHTVINNQNPLDSYLVFSSEDFSLGEGKLTASEIMTQQLNSRLAVLSACNTGSGKIREGEGIMGLARSFIRAGCPNLVLNLWAMDDNFGRQIVNAFYSNLEQGQSLSKSLQEAKIQHIKKAKKPQAHPHYWAGVILLGRDNDLEMPQKSSLAWTILLVILALGAIVIYQVKRK